MTTGTEARRSTRPEPSAPRAGTLRLPRPGLATTLVLLGVYAASRLVTTLFLAVVHALTATATWAQHDGGPGFAGYLSSWDAVFYREISEQGYPVELPRDDDGQVVKNAWAFMPLFPALVRVVRPADRHVVATFDYAGRAIEVACSSLSSISWTSWACVWA